MDDRIQTVEPVPQAQIDFSQLAPLVTEFQRGEVEKLKVTHDAQIAIAELSAKRQMDVDKSLAARELRQDRYDAATTGLLFMICLAMMGYGMWAHDVGFITAGVSSFAAFLAGKRGLSTKDRKE
jgi:hypothetical protein